jgi:uncharacterized membrane protein required for colicin V production
MTLTIYDAAMAGIVVAGMIWGSWRGVTWQIASIASLILGYIASHQLSPQLAPQFGTDPVVSRTLAMMTIYAVVSGCVFLVAWIFRSILRKLQFEAFDKHLGMLLGGMEGALLGILVTFFVVSLAPQTRDPIYSSPTGKMVASLIDTIGPTFKQETKDVLAPFVEESKQAAWSADKLAPLLPEIEAQAKKSSDSNDGTVERR